MVKVSCSYVVRGERGVLFLFPAKRPPLEKNSCPGTRAGQANGAYVQLGIQFMPFVGQSSLRSDSRSTAKSITTSALSDVRIRRHFRSNKQQVHRCSCNESNEFVAIV